MYACTRMCMRERGRGKERQRKKRAETIDWLPEYLKIYLNEFGIIKIWWHWSEFCSVHLFSFNSLSLCLIGSIIFLSLIYTLFIFFLFFSSFYLNLIHLHNISLYFFFKFYLDKLTKKKIRLNCYCTLFNFLYLLYVSLSHVFYM